jgi:DNA-binding MarR family transcriptional regulator
MSDSRRPTQAKYDSLEQEAFLNLWRTYDRLRELEDSLFARYEISAQQYNALRLLRDARPAKLPTLTLGSRLISRAPDMTRLLDRLEARQLIERHRKPDNRRVVEVGITQQGLALLDELAQLVRDCHERQLAHLSASELKALIALLKGARAPHERQPVNVSERL